MAVLALIKNTILMNIGNGDFLKEQDVVDEESSFGQQFDFQENRKREACSLLKSIYTKDQL